MKKIGISLTEVIIMNSYEQKSSSIRAQIQIESLLPRHKHVI